MSITLYINEENSPTESLVEPVSLAEIDPPKFVLGDQIEIKIKVIDLTLLSPIWASNPNTKYILAIGDLENRIILTQAQERSREDGYIYFMLDLNTELLHLYLTDDEEELTLEIQVDDAIGQSRTLLQKKVVVLNEIIVGDVFPQYPSEVEAVIL